MIKLIRNFIKKTKPFQLIIGLFLITFIIWNRILREHLPRTIPELLNNPFIVRIVYVNIFILSIVILYNIWLLKSVKRKESHFLSKYLKNIPGITTILAGVIWLNNNIIESPKTVFEAIIKKVNIIIIFEKPFYFISQFFEDYVEKKSPSILSLTHVLFVTIPKTFTAVIFLIDLLFFEELYYFYRIMVLLVIPLSYTVLLYILGNLSDKKIYYSTAHLKIVSNSEEDIVQFQDEIPKIEHAIDFIAQKYDRNLLEWFFIMFNTHRSIKWLVYNLIETKKKYAPYELIIISSIYLTGWLKILLYIS